MRGVAGSTFGRPEVKEGPRRVWPLGGEAIVNASSYHMEHGPLERRDRDGAEQLPQGSWSEASAWVTEQGVLKQFRHDLALPLLDEL